MCRAFLIALALCLQTASSAAQISPGVGAGTEDPKAVLSAADAAASAIREISYEASYEATGAFATRSASSRGEVKIERLPAGNPLAAKLSVSGQFYAAGASEPEPMRAAFDGRTIYRLRHAERALLRKPLLENDPKQRQLGFVTGLLGAGPNQLIMFEFVLDKPFARQLAGDVLDYEGRANVGGVPCHVVYVEYGRRPDGRVRRERWFFGLRDKLPRRVEQLEVDDKGRPGAYVLTLSNLRTRPSRSSLSFTVLPPKGFKLKPYETAQAPSLLPAGAPAPAWELKDSTGRTHALSEYRGRLVLLDFWATWCGPCVRAMPGLQRLHERYGERGLVVLGVNAWEESNAAAYMKERGYSYGLLLKGEDVARAYRVVTLPTVYLIGRDGQILYSGIGGEAEDLAPLIERHLAP